MELEDRSLVLRSDMIANGILDEMSKLQPSLAPILKLGNRIQYTFQFIDEENNNKEILEWYIGTVIKLSTGDSLYQGVKPYRKNAAVKVKWESNADYDSSTSIVEIKKSMFNVYVEHSWRLFFDVEWSNKLLQLAWERQEQRESSELIRDIDEV